MQVLFGGHNLPPHPGWDRVNRSAKITPCTPRDDTPAGIALDLEHWTCFCTFKEINEIQLRQKNFEMKDISCNCFIIDWRVSFLFYEEYCVSKFLEMQLWAPSWLSLYFVCCPLNFYVNYEDWCSYFKWLLHEEYLYFLSFIKPINLFMFAAPLFGVKMLLRYNVKSSLYFQHPYLVLAT